MQTSTRFGGPLGGPPPESAKIRFANISMTKSQFILSPSDRTRQSVRVRPSEMDSFSNQSRAESKTYGPLRYCQGHPIMCQAAVCTTIVGLHPTGGPRTVPGCVVLIWVSAFDGHSIWTLAHIS